ARADRWPYRTRRPAFSPRGRGVHRGGRRRSTPDGALGLEEVRMATKKAAAKTRGTAKKKAATKAAARRGKTKVNAATVEYGTDTGATPGGTLVIVESPAKAKTIGKYLGRGYRVRATVGHIMDLPEKKLGIDVDNGFLPDLVPIPGKEKTI